MTPKDQYIAHQACNVYIATILQLQATFNFLFATQVINQKEKVTKLLNKCLQWQINYAN